MKSYKQWKKENLSEGILGDLIEKGKDFFKTGMGPQTDAYLSRLGMLLGKKRFRFSTEQQGKDLLNSLNNIEPDAGSPPPPSTATKLLDLINSDKIDSNSPIKTAYHQANKIKQTFTKKNLEKTDMMLLLKILMNCHSKGMIAAGELNELWINLVGFIDEHGNIAKDEDKLRKASINELDTPVGLLNRFLSIPGGVFTPPNNAQELKEYSEKILKHFSPKKYERLYRAYIEKLSGSTISSKPAAAPGSTSAKSAASGSPTASGASGGTTPSVEDLQQIIQRIKDGLRRAEAELDPKTVKAMISNIIKSI